MKPVLSTFYIFLSQYVNELCRYVDSPVKLVIITFEYQPLAIRWRISESNR